MLKLLVTIKPNYNDTKGDIFYKRMSQSLQPKLVSYIHAVFKIQKVLIV
jgi:hypothetical protein